MSKSLLRLAIQSDPLTADLFQKVAEQLRRNRRAGGSLTRNRYGAILRGLLHCKACGHAMVHNFTGRNGKQYRFYTCTRSIKSGRQSGPSGSLPASQIEQVVIDRIRSIAHDPDMVTEVLRQARVLAEIDWAKQRQMWQRLLSNSCRIA